jgi:ubiquinone/menaquinone biosynthesis C-methylase UbiE
MPEKTRIGGGLSQRPEAESSLDRRPPWDNCRMAVEIDVEGAEPAALARLGGLDGLRVLEVGCGNGRLTFRYAGRAASVLAFDPDADAIAEARASTPPELAARVRFEVGDAVHLAVPREFDAVFLSHAL